MGADFIVRQAISANAAHRVATAATNVVGWNRAPVRLLINEPAHDWRPEAVRALEELVRLESGWDGYGAGPVSFENATFALRMLESACPIDAPMPQIVPGVDGDLQIEWHTAVADIELHLIAPNHVIAWREVPGSPPEETHLTNDFAIVANWVRQLLEPNGAHSAAAA